MSSATHKTELEIITFRDAFLSLKKHSPEYNKAAAVIYLSEEDIKKLNTSSGQKIFLENNHGKIEAEVKLDKTCYEAVGLMPASTLVNRITTVDENFQSLKQLKVTAYT